MSAVVVTVDDGFDRIVLLAAVITVRYPSVVVFSADASGTVELVMSGAVVFCSGYRLCDSLVASIEAVDVSREVVVDLAALESVGVVLGDELMVVISV